MSDSTNFWPGHRRRSHSCSKLCGRPPQYASAPVTLTFDLLTLKVVSESRVRWVTSVLILVFLSLSVLEIGPMYATDRQASDRRRQTKASLNASAHSWRGTVISAYGRMIGHSYLWHFIRRFTLFLMYKSLYFRLEIAHGSVTVGQECQEGPRPVL